GVRRLRGALERASGDLGHGRPVDDPVGHGLSGLEPTPFHGRCSLRNAPTSRLKTSGRSKYVEWPAASTRSKREPGTCACTLADSSGQISPSSSLVRKKEIGRASCRERGEGRRVAMRLYSIGA